MGGLLCRWFLLLLSFIYLARLALLFLFIFLYFNLALLYNRDGPLLSQIAFSPSPFYLTLFYISGLLCSYLLLQSSICYIYIQPLCLARAKYICSIASYRNQFFLFFL